MNREYRNKRIATTEEDIGVDPRWQQTGMYTLGNIEKILTIIMWATITGSALLAGIFVRLLLS